MSMTLQTGKELVIEHRDTNPGITAMQPTFSMPEHLPTLLAGARAP